jgi:methionyl-tRNA formyltransferase
MHQRKANDSIEFKMILQQKMQKKTKIVYMGTPDFALAPLKVLVEDPDFEVTAVVTQEDKKVGRKQHIEPPPVKKLALEHGITVLQPPRLKGNDQFLDLIKGLKPDFIVVVAYGKVLPPELLKIPKYSCVNLHPSLLPKYRGATPIEEALRKGETQTGITVMKIAEKLDSGDIYYLQKVPILPDDNAQILRLKLSLVGATVLPEILKDIKEGTLTPLPQDETKATYCHKITREDGLIELKNMTTEEILNHLRAYTPWPGCYLLIKGKRLKILEAEIDSEKNAPPGQIIELGKNTIGLGTKKGLLIPKKVQLEGKKEVPIEAFLAGNRGLFE